MDHGYSHTDCIRLLTDKQRDLSAAGEERYPRRSDFTDAEVCAIKAYLGPWPRALEAAGLKPPRSDDRPQKDLEKRIRAKRRRTAARLASIPEARRAADGEKESPSPTDVEAEKQTPQDEKPIESNRSAFD